LLPSCGITSPGAVTAGVVTPEAFDEADFGCVNDTAGKGRTIAGG